MDANRINEAFEKWVAKYVKENDNIDYDLILLEDMLAAWKQSRIDTLDEIKDGINDGIIIGGVMSVVEYIDTELKKAGE